MATIDNTVIDRGEGKWIFALYKPEEYDIGPFEGHLYVTKDFHSVQQEDGNYIVNIPSQNVAYVVDGNHYKRIKKYNNLNQTKEE